MKILIPLDGSTFAEEVLEPVNKLANLSREKLEVHLITIIDPDSTFTCLKPPPVEEDDIETHGLSEGLAEEPQDRRIGHQAKEASDYLERIAERYFPYTARTKVIVGMDVGAEIMACACGEKIDLIAIATHGRSGVAGEGLGGVAGCLLGSHVAPLFLVRPDKINGGNGQSDTLPLAEPWDEFHRRRPRWYWADEKGKVLEGYRAKEEV